MFTFSHVLHAAAAAHQQAYLVNNPTKMNTQHRASVHFTEGEDDDDWRCEYFEPLNWSCLIRN